MSAALVWCGLAVLVGLVALRPRGYGPALGAALAAGLAAVGGVLTPADLRDALAGEWRAFVTLAAVMLMTSAAERRGLLERLAARIEPYTRGPVKHAFRVTFALALLVAAVLSNDAAVLVVTPAILALLRTVYPKRNPKFLVPFAFAVFAAAGVAPLVISNPMNLVFAEHRGIDFNRYALTMIPVALASSLATYAALAWCFRDALADGAPALGAWPTPPTRLDAAGRVILAALALELIVYPIMSYLGAPLWPVAAAGGAVCVAASLAAGDAPRALLRGVSLGLFPFLFGVFLLALALQRIGVVDHLVALYAGSRWPLLTVGATSSVGSALLNNHPMSLLNAFALDRVSGPNLRLSLAALIGGDLGPRLLPVGSLAALLWFDVLGRHGVVVRVTTFVRVGIALTLPALVVALAVLWAISPH